MERRAYPRINVSLETGFIKKDFKSGEGKEFIGRIEDISEGGIRFSVSEPENIKIVESMKIGDRVYFQAVDEYELFGKARMEVVQGESIVVRKKVEADKAEVGCRLGKRDEELMKYINNKEICVFVSGK